MPGIEMQQLAKKLEHLYSRGLVINNQTKLAAELGVGAANLTSVRTLWSELCLKAVPSADAAQATSCLFPSMPHEEQTLQARQ